MSESTPTIEQALGLKPSEPQTNEAPKSETKDVSFEDSALYDPMGIEDASDVDVMAASLGAPVSDSADVGIEMTDDDDIMPTAKEKAAPTGTEGDESAESGDEDEGEESEESEGVTLTQEQYDKLLATAERALGRPALAAGQTPTQSPESPSVAAPAPPEAAQSEEIAFGDFEMPPELAQQVGILDAEAFSKHMNKYMEKAAGAMAGRAVQRMLGQITPIMAQQVNEYTPIAVAAYQFDNNHPEYRDSPNLVREAIREVMQEKPDLSPNAIFEDVNKRISYAAKKAKKLAKKVDTVTKSTSKAKGTSGRKAAKPRISSRDEIFREIAALDMPVEDGMDMF